MMMMIRLLICLGCLLGACVPAPAETNALLEACHRNDYAGFVKQANLLPDNDVRLGEALLDALDGLSYAHYPMKFRKNPITRQKIIDYLLERGVGNMMMPSPRLSPDAYYDKEMPVAVLAVYKAVLMKRFYPAILIASHCDIRPYINERLKPNQTTLLYMALERDNMRTVQILILCGADEKLHPVNAPPISKLVKTKGGEVQYWWPVLISARSAEVENRRIYGLTRPRYY